jgi:hypothetical protein
VPSRFALSIGLGIFTSLGYLATILRLEGSLSSSLDFSGSWLRVCVWLIAILPSALQVILVFWLGSFETWLIALRASSQDLGCSSCLLLSWNYLKFLSVMNMRLSVCLRISFTSRIFVILAIFAKGATSLLLVLFVIIRHTLVNRNKLMIIWNNCRNQ